MRVRGGDGKKCEKFADVINGSTTKRENPFSGRFRPRQIKQIKGDNRRLKDDDGSAK